MPNAPDTDNYALGSGIAYFDVKDANGKYSGERDLGNCTVFNLGVAVDKLEHFTQRSGLRAKDKSVVSLITPSVAFTLDEINVENVALMFMGETSEVAQPASSALSFLIDVSTMPDDEVKGNRYLDVGEYRNIGVYKLPYDGGAVAVAARGETVTGAGGATAVVLNLMSGSDTVSGTMMVGTVTGTFVEDETISSSGTMTGVVNCPITSTHFDTASGILFDTTDVAISDDSTNATILAKTVDYTVDSATGRVYVVVGGGLAGADADYDVEFAVKAQTFTKIMAFNETSIEGRLRFVADNAVGNNMSAMIWRVDLSPAGEVAMIGEDWQALEFGGEVLKDSVNHPDEPYYRIETTDTVA